MCGDSLIPVGGKAGIRSCTSHGCLIVSGSGEFWGQSDALTSLLWQDLRFPSRTPGSSEMIDVFHLSCWSFYRCGWSAHTVTVLPLLMCSANALMDLVSDRSSFLMTRFSFPVSSKISVRASSALSKSLQAITMRAPEKSRAVESWWCHISPPFHTNLSPTFCCSGGAATLYCLEFIYVCSPEYEQAIIENAMMDGHIEHCELPLVSVEALK